MIRLYFLVIFTMSFLILFCSVHNSGCSEDCLTVKPEFGDLHISMTINTQNPELYLNVYQGDYDNGHLVITDTLSTDKVTYTLALGSYSATVLYKEGADSILAVDGATISADQSNDCEDCWIVSDGYIDLTL